MTRINWLGHATFELTFDSGEVLVLDPWIEGNPAYPKEHKFSRIDAIAITHAHPDHTGGVQPLAKQFSPKIVAMYEFAYWLESRGVKNINGINKGATLDLGFVKLTMTHAVHSSGIKENGNVFYGGDPAGYVLTFKDGRTAYFAGDTSAFYDMKLIAEIYQPELAFLPIGDHYTMGPREAAVAARLVGAKKIIPIHWGTFPALTGTPDELKKHLQNDPVEVWTLERGQPVEW